MVMEKDTFVGRAYKAFYKKNGYFPKYFNPYNCAEIRDIAPTVTTQCGSTTTSACVLILESKESKTDG